MVDLAVETLKKKQKLRNAEYYDIQSVFDELHLKAVNTYKFNDLMPLISSEDNILLAYRNIKNNKGSGTKGTDGKTINHYKEWSEGKFVDYFQDKLSNYQPKSVRRVEIPKDYQPGKTRPLGIPCMDDRIIQQCILQVLEPICEAKFHKHSYGFRPNRSTEHAIARTQFLMWMSNLHYVVDIDIKGFFDNVNHGKLLKQMWAVGIQDKNLLSIIGRILKSEIMGIGKPTKGTPQGGIISPLLSNIVLNELDWWLSDQWETFETKHSYSGGHKFRAIRTTNLKEFFFVRYADDFKILCRDYKTAQKIFTATRLWLKERLGLDINPEKSKITNIRKGKTEFLGLALYVVKKKKKFITRSNVTYKAKETIKRKLKDRIKAIRRNAVSSEVNKLNGTILGLHNYYNMATTCSLDFYEINYIVSRSLYNRLSRNMKEKPYKSKAYLKFYGDYKGKTITIARVTIFPIYGCTFKSPNIFTQETNNYTEHGRKLVHDRLHSVSYLVKYLLNRKEYDKSVEYNDNRISLMAGQNGKCGVTGAHLIINSMECHHKKPKELGGTDSYENLVWLKSDVHKLIHATAPDTVEKYLKLFNLDNKALKKVNSLRMLAGNSEIVATI
jgi:group II intron reverse transcriptase/maturase